MKGLLNPGADLDCDYGTCCTLHILLHEPINAPLRVCWPLLAGQSAAGARVRAEHEHAEVHRA